MKIGAEHKLAGEITLYDVMGKQILGVLSFDPDTNEAEVVLATTDKSIAVFDINGLNRVGKFKVVVPGAKLRWIKSGKEVTEGELNEK